MNNPQTFCSESDRYALYRPHYPDDLFAFLSSLCSEHEKAWDCATGNGQAAIASAGYFSSVEATDISPEQIRNSLPHPRVQYSVSAAEKTQFQDSIFDLITVAQAVHWFDLPLFSEEVHRVMKPEGVLAIMGYYFPIVDPKIDRIISSEFYERIDPFWASGNRLLMNGYREITFPFPEIPIPHRFQINVEWDLPRLLAYFSTWSAVKRYSTERGLDPLGNLREALSGAWEEPEEPRKITMPVLLKAWRNQQASTN
jgi:SAM-dependent methyltransferase